MQIHKEEHLISWDNSFRESFCYLNGQSQRKDVDKKLNAVIDGIKSKVPNFSEESLYIDMPIAMYESIRLHKLSPDEKVIDDCFPPVDSMLMHYNADNHNELPDQMVNFLDKQISTVLNNLLELYKNFLDPQAMIDKVDEKLIQELHPKFKRFNEYLLECRDDLVKNQKSSYIFQQLCRDLAWDSLVKHQKWHDLAKIDLHYQAKENSDENYLKFDEASIIKRLIAYYLTNTQEKDYLAGSALFIKYAKLLKNRRSSGFWNENEELLRPYKERERMDPYHAEHACSGAYCNKTKQKKQTIVITCDLKQKNRVIDYIYAKKRINEELEKIGLTSQPFLPGYIIMVKPNNPEDLIDVINIADLIDTVILPVAPSTKLREDGR